MGRSGRSSGGGRSGGGRSGGSRSSGRSASTRSSSRSFSSSGSRSFSSNRGYGGNSYPRSMGGSGFGGSTHRTPGYGGPHHSYDYGRRRVRMGGSIFGGGNIFIGGNTYNGGGFGGGVFSGSDCDKEPVFTNTASNTTQTSDTASNTTTKTNKSSGVWTAIIVIFIFVFLMYLIVGTSSDGYSMYSTAVCREKIDAKAYLDAGFYTDESGWIRNQTVLNSGLQEFYDTTGIAPYVYITDNIQGNYDPSTEQLEQYACQAYEQLFRDDAHILLLFWDYGGAYEYVLWLGEDTYEFMDQEACDILFDHLDYQYYYADTEDEMFADAFADAGRAMMNYRRTAEDYTGILLIGVLVACIYIVVKVKKKRRKEKEAQLKKILDTPLQKYGSNSDVLENLEEKYKKEI